MKTDKEFKHVVSLGWLCCPAQEIERIGYRDASYPFDWLLTHDFSIVIKLLECKEEFKFSNGEMLQYRNDASKWYNKRYVISLFHDFTKYKRMIESLEEVSDKYSRRFKRLYRTIIEPTLFLRYIKDEEEAHYVSRNASKIEATLKNFNPHNKIVYIANRELRSCLTGMYTIYFVDKDENDTVARKFLINCPELYRYIVQNVQKPSTFKPPKKWGGEVQLVLV